MSDSFARNVFLALIKDFRLSLGSAFAEGIEKRFLEGVTEFRDYKFPSLGHVSVQLYKAHWQLENLFKRYTFLSDKYTSDDLRRLTYEKYVDFQVKRSEFKKRTHRSFLVLREARRIAKEILSEKPNFVEMMRNGRRAANGVTLEEAYFDNKLGDPSHFTCPSALRHDLFQQVKNDPYFRVIFKRLCKKAGGKHKLNLCADVLTLTLVPKSWKALRPITPLSVYGLFYSYGIKGYVERCLSMSNLDIKRLQERHKMLAKRFSRSRSHVTADLTSASDSLRSDILNSVLPRFLYSELKKTFTKYVKIEKTQVYTSSCLPMGNAATFPVETLVFYCLIKAIGNLLKVKGTYSAYGDDLIYPTRIHTHVCAIFADLGIGVNKDKTSVTPFFRESCGGDYYRGCDVRPFLFPEDRLPSKGKLAKAQYLYKVLNTLLQRWDKTEVPHTYRYILAEISYVSGHILQVPLSYPHTSGYKVDKPILKDWPFPFKKPEYGYKDGSTFVSFKFIGQKTPKHRRIIYEDIYLWDSEFNLFENFVSFPDYKCSWGRYSQPGATKELSKWFLKTLRFKDGEARTSGSKFRSEPLHGEGSAKVNVSQLSSWT